MAEQRRYTQEQKDRVVSSGEKPAERNIVSRTLRNVAVAGPRAATDLMSLAGMVPSLIDAGLSSERDIADSMFGKEGLDEINQYVNDTVSSAIAALPEDKRTDENINNIRNAVVGSRTVANMQTERMPALARWGTKAGDFVNDLAGLPPVREETITDDLTQIAAQSMMPIGNAITRGTAAGSRVGAGVARRAVMKAVELSLPGTTGGAGNIAANIGVGAALSQGGRALGDAPSVFTGDAFAADMGLDVNSDVDPVDPDAGMGAEQYAAAAAVAGGASMAAAVLFGKGSRTVAKTIIDEIDNPPPKVPGPDDELSPTLSVGERLQSEVESTAPLRSIVRRADPFADQITRDNKVADIERVANDTASVNIKTSMGLADTDGIIPGLGWKSIPIKRLDDALAQSEPQEVELFNKAMYAKTLLDQHALRIRSTEDDLVAAKMGIKDSEEGRRKFYAIKVKLDKEKSDVATLADGMTIKEARDLATQMDMNPKLAAVQSMYRQIANDILDAKLADTQLTRADVDAMRKAQPNFMHIQQAPEGDWWNSMKRWITGNTNSELFSNNRAPLLSRDPNGKVDKPLPAIDALRSQMYDHIKYTRYNEATRTFVNAVKNTPEWGRSIRELDSMSLDEFRLKGMSDKVKNNTEHFTYTGDGRIHFMEAADPEVRRALRFNPPATLGVFNMMRKWFQHGTTGMFAPEFAPIAASYENQIVRATRKPGRAYGMIDSTLRRALPNSTALSRVMDTIGDPTSKMQMYAGLFQMTKASLFREASEQIAGDLAKQSGLFHLLSKAPGGQAALVRASDAMLRAYNDSRFATYVNAGIKQSNLMDDPIRAVREGFNAVEYVTKKVPGLNPLFRAYMSTLEAVHNTSKYAFFAQNLAALERKYQHRGSIPQAELDKLIKETKIVSGDMTRAPGNEALSKTLSAVPYGHIAVNSTYHLASAIRHDPLNTGARILSGAVLPKLAAIGMISAIPSTSEWYWNELPTWQRISRIPVIGPDWWMDVASGNQRAITPNDIYMMPEAPELIPITNMMSSFARSLGWFGSGPQSNSDMLRDIGEGMESITSVGAPPALVALAGGARIDFGRMVTGWMTGKGVFDDAYLEDPHQGFNTTGINADSMISRSAANAITALFGTAVGNILQSTDVAVQALEDGYDFPTVFKQALGYQLYGMERRLPEEPGTREAGAYLYTGGQRRRYATTQQRERVMEVMGAFEPVMRQLTVERDKRGLQSGAEDEGLQALQTIQHPRVRKLAEDMYGMLAKGKMKTLQEDRSGVNASIRILDASRETLNPAAYHQKHDALMQKMNGINAEQESVINQLEVLLHQRYQVDIAGAIELVEGSLGR